MSDSFTYLSPLTEEPNVQKYICAITLGIGLIILGKILSSKLSTEEGVKQAVVPSKEITVFSFFELFFELFAKFQDSVIGKNNRKYLPVTFSIFVFILFANLIGLIPGMPAITTTVWVTVAIALFSFLFFNTEGLKEHGFVGYLKHFTFGLPIKWYTLLLIIFIFSLELLSVFLRPLTLNLRLYWNITADHSVLHALTGLFGIGAFPVYLIGTFVCVVQATVFTILSMLYINLATQHESESDHG